MNVERIRRRFIRKIEREIQIYKRKCMKNKPEEILANAYKIMCMISIYENLLDLVQGMSEERIQSLTKMSGVLSYLYEGWLKCEDSFEDELRECILYQITDI